MKLEDLEEANDNRKFWIAVIIMIITIGFAAAIFAHAQWKLYKHMEKRYDDMFYRVEKRPLLGSLGTYIQTTEQTTQSSKSQNVPMKSESLSAVKRELISYTAMPGEFIVG